MMNPPGKLAHATPTTAPLEAGRRSFFKYRDLGVTAARASSCTCSADGSTSSSRTLAMGKRASSRAARSASTVKQRVLAALEKLPADATFEDAIKRLVFLAKID